jgi:hypothetical protein
MTLPIFRVLPLLLLLAACATSPPAPVIATAPLPYPTTVRERMLRIVMEEWQEWGRITLWDGQPRPAARPQESQPANFPRVLAYWRAVDDEGRAAIDRNRGRYAALLGLPGTPGALWGEPAWSAAFVSYVLRNAGVDQREFPSSAAHAFYIDGMLADAMAYPAQAPFVPRDIGAYAPQPGDLVCADRSRRPLAGWRERLAERGQFRPMHCDIVVAAGGGSVQAVGGNIADAVTLSVFGTDAAGRLVARAPGQPIWFAVFENRLGRLPPFNAIPIAGLNAGHAPS